MFILEKEDRELFNRVQEQNLNRQYELLTNCIEIGMMKGPVSFDKFLLWALNHVAVANISQFGGRFRREPIYVGDHSPPHFNDVDDWMDRFVSTVQENWYVWTPTELAAYGLWRLNWIYIPLLKAMAAPLEQRATFYFAFDPAHYSPGTELCPSESAITEMDTRLR